MNFNENNTYRSKFTVTDYIYCVTFYQNQLSCERSFLIKKFPFCELKKLKKQQLLYIKFSKHVSEIGVSRKE